MFKENCFLLLTANGLPLTAHRLRLTAHRSPLTGDGASGNGATGTCPYAGRAGMVNGLRLTGNGET
ncbi:MAG TPA: hypothetical protein PLQ57_11385, partial [Saprospiraceae bacterium]|nr:hypothetical protein [Saprospiraceae bacterium]